MIATIFMEKDFIKLRGVRVHNLKNVSLEIPKNKFVVITGVSGSGKSSLAFDTIYAESERRYLESLSGYARQFLGVKDRPDYDKIEGLSPAIAIDQHSITKNPRSTVATVTEIYDYLRILFARIGEPFCPNCHGPVSKQTQSQILEAILKQKNSSKLPEDSLVLVLATLIDNKKGEHKGILSELETAGFSFVRFDGNLWRVEELLQKDISKTHKHSLDLVLDRLVLGEDWERPRLSEAIERALKSGKGMIKIGFVSPKTFKPLAEDSLFSEKFACVKCGINFPEIEPRIFSFNNPYGACQECTGLGYLIKIDPELLIPNKNLTLAEGAVAPSLMVGQRNWQWLEMVELSERLSFSLRVPVRDLPEKALKAVLYGDEIFGGVIADLERRWKESSSDFVKGEIEKYMTRVLCPECQGKRLNKIALAVKISGKNIFESVALPIDQAFEFFKNLKLKSVSQKQVAEPLLKEILKRLGFMIDIGLNYLSLDRESTTLAGGEAQRIRLATQIGSGLSGVIYILDEPSIGMHPRDIGRLIKNLKLLRDLGNTVIVVEHDEQTIRAADWLIDVGPGAGSHGGRIIFEGEPKKLESSAWRSKTLTGEYLSGKKKIFREKKTFKAIQKSEDKFIEIIGAGQNNLKQVSVKIPLGKLVVVAGVSGSGKSSLIVDTLAPVLQRYFYSSKEVPGKHQAVNGLEKIDKVVVVDQSPIGRTPRSNPATYTGMFDFIREIFSQTRVARSRGYEKGRFSFNLKGGRCEVCEGQGYQKIEMYFLPDVYVECEECHGSRYKREILEAEYNGKNIAEILKMNVEEARKFFKHFPQLDEKLKLLEEVGLGYLELGQSATTLSGGEAQRIKLSSELSRRQTGKSFYILDEPTTGLHFEDVAKLLKVLDHLVQKGNTVLVVEHELDIIRNADWVVELGPEGGDGGGEIVFEGTPEELKSAKFKNKSWTGKYL